MSNPNPDKPVLKSHRRPAGDTGVVAQHMHRAVGLHRSIRQRLHGLQVGLVDRLLDIAVADEAPGVHVHRTQGGSPGDLPGRMGG